MTDVTGADIIGALLRADTAVLAAVPAAQMKEEQLPDGTSLPAMVVHTISSVERQPLVRGETVRTTDRVAVMVRAASLRERKRVMQIVKRCCAGRTGDVGGGVRVSILTAGTGPGLIGPANSFEQTQDFRVSYDAEA